MFSSICYYIGDENTIHYIMYENLQRPKARMNQDITVDYLEIFSYHNFSNNFHFNSIFFC